MPWGRSFNFEIGILLRFRSHEENHQIMPAAQGGMAGSVRFLLTKNPARSLNYPGCQGPGITFELFPPPWQTIGPVSGPFVCADYSLRRGWNTTHRQLGLGPIGRRATSCSPSASPRLRWPEIVAETLRAAPRASRLGVLSTWIYVRYTKCFADRPGMHWS